MKKLKLSIILIVIIFIAISLISAYVYENLLISIVGITGSIYLAVSPLKKVLEAERIDKMSVPQIKKLWKKSNVIHKKNFLTYVNFGSNNPFENHHNKTIERIKNYEREQNFKKTGKKLTDFELSEFNYQTKEKKRLTKKFGSGIANKINKGDLWIGMSLEMLEEIKGRPAKKIEKISRGKKREELFYHSYKNRLGNNSYKLRVVVINGEVDSWNDI